MAELFVFGTLKRGFPLHDKGLHGAYCLGAGRTIQCFPLLVAGRWFAPMMLNRPGLGRRVSGELYQVSEPRLALLDGLESVGRPGNFRMRIEVERTFGCGTYWAYAYMKSPLLARPVHSDFLQDYQDRRFIAPGADRRG